MRNRLTSRIRRSSKDLTPERRRHRRNSRRKSAGAARRLGDDRPHLAGRQHRPNSPAGKYLIEHGVERKDFNSYGSRRGNHEVMMRGTFANIRIRNQMAPGTEGGVTTYLPTDEVMPIYDASMKYQDNGTPLVVIAGKEYGTGSSRDWAAKGTLPARHQSGHRRKLRAHPPQQPGRHGRAAAAIRERRTAGSRSASPAAKRSTSSG